MAKITRNYSVSWQRLCMGIQKTTYTPDNKNKHDGRDRSKVDANDKSEVEYLHSQHPALTHEEILDAVRKYGPSRKDIEAHLQR